MSVVGSVSVRVVPSFSGMTKSISQQFTRAGATAGQTMSRTFSDSIRSMGTGIQDVGRQVSSVGGSLTKGITLPAAGAAAAVGGITAALGWGRLKSIDSAQGQLRGLGYSTEDVARITENLVGALEGGMLTMGEATSAAASGMAAGVEEGEELTRYIQLLDAATAGSNGTFDEMNQIFSRIQGSGKLMTGELDMIEQRMPGFSGAAADALGVTQEEMRAMVSAGEVSADDFLDIMDDFGGDMATEYAKTWEGMVQNTKAYVGILGENLLSGVFEDSKLAIGEFIEFLASPAVGEWATEMGTKIGDAFQSVLETVKSVIEWWINLDDETKRLIATVAGIAVALGPVLLAIGTTITVIGGLIAKMAFLANPITWVVAGIAALTAGLIWFFTQTEAGQHVWGQLTDAARAAAGWFQDSVLPVLQDIGAYIADTLVPAVLDFAENALTALWEAAKTAADYFVNNVLPVLVDVGSYIKDTLIPNVVDFAQGALADMVDAAKDVGDYIQNTLIPAFQDFGDWVVDNEGKIKGFVTVITLILLPAMGRIVGGWVAMGIAAIVSGAQTAAVWLLYRIEAIKSAAAYVVQSFRVIGTWVAMALAAIVSGAQTAAVWLLYRLEAIKAAVVYVAQSWRIIGAWVAMSTAAVVSGLRTAAVWAIQVVGAAVAGAASFIISAGRVVGGWVLMSIQSLLHAGRMAAAWFIALGPIGWVTAAIIAIAALVIANWDKIVYWTKKAWSAVMNFIVGAWQSIRDRTMAILGALVTWIRDRFNSIRDTAARIWGAIRDWIVDAWVAIRTRTTNILGALVTWIRDRFNSILDTTTRIWNGVRDKISDVWNSIRDKISDTWNNKIKPVFEAFGNFMLDTTVGQIEKGIDMIKSAWETVANIFRNPINWVINTVWNGGIKKAFDAVSKAVGSDTRMAEVKEIGAFAKGGLAPKGWALVGEEGPELVNFKNPGRVYTANQTRAAMGSDAKEGQHVHPMGGGWVSKVWGSVKDAASGALAWVRGGLANAAESLLKPVISKATGAMSGFGTMGALGGGLIDNGVDRILEWIRGKDTVEDAGGAEYTGPMQKGGVNRPANGPITSWYGMRGGRLHGGVDFAGALGSAVYAIRDGVVHSIQNYSGSGHSVNLSHGGGSYSHYGHNRYGGIPVSVGQAVKAGQRIGTIGMTGRTTGPHVHLETWQGGMWNRRNPNALYRDNGGPIYPGLNMVQNNTGKLERTFNDPDFQNLRKTAEIAVGRGGASGPVVENHYHGVNMDQSYRLAQETTFAVRSAGRKAGAR